MVARSGWYKALARLKACGLLVGVAVWVTAILCMASGEDIEVAAALVALVGLVVAGPAVVKQFIKEVKAGC